MSGFTEALVVTPLADGKTWVVVREFGYDVGEEGSGDRVDVAVGFETDFATIPRVLWWLLPRWGRYGNAAVIHDWLYWIQSRPRKRADYIFLEGMAVLEVGWLTRQVMYRMVRLFGWIAWTRNRADRTLGFDRVRSDPTLKAATMSQRPATVSQVTRYVLRRAK